MQKKILVLGGGMIGSAMAEDLQRRTGVECGGAVAVEEEAEPALVVGSGR